MYQKMQQNFTSHICKIYNIIHLTWVHLYIASQSYMFKIDQAMLNMGISLIIDLIIIPVVSTQN